MARLGLLAIVILGCGIAVVSGVFSGAPDDARGADTPTPGPAGTARIPAPAPPFATDRPLGRPRGFYFTRVCNDKPLKPRVCCRMITPRIT